MKGSDGGLVRRVGTSSSDDLKRARRRVVGAMARFLNRCAKQQFIGQKQRQAAAARICE
jgi:hypothetical protein